MIVGREDECGRIAAVLDAARDGQPEVLKVVGEPGIGKTALLEWATEQASDMTVCRAVGVESETELEFSDLFDVVRPMMAHLKDLPVRQRDALNVALGLAAGPAADRFTIGAAVLSLISAAADVTPVLIMVDDAQWIDEASCDALRFALRRLRAERVAVLVGTRDGRSIFADEQRFGALSLTALDVEASQRLLAEQSGADVGSEVAAQIQHATGGNALALVEVARLLTARQLAGLEPLEDPLPVGRTVERLFTERAHHLDRSNQRALLVAAVSASCRLAPVLAALNHLGLDVTALEAAEDAGLVRLSADRVSFRHPLIRSAVVHGAPASERRQAHAALASVLDLWSEDERVHHLAAAALGPDADIADAVAAAAERARSRSAWASAASAFERSARLTPRADLGHDRLLEAAEAAWVAGQIGRTFAWVGEVLAADPEPPQRARAQHLRSRSRLHCGPVDQALDDLEQVAERLARTDPSASVPVWADAVEAALLVGDLSRAVVAGERAYALRRVDGDLRTGFVGAFAWGQALHAAGRGLQARGPLAAVTEMLAGSELLQTEVRALTRGAEAAQRLGLLDIGMDLAGRACKVAREQGAFGPLAHALVAQSALDLVTGQWSLACAHATEGLERADDGRCAWTAVRCREHLAWLGAAQGSTQACRRQAQRAAGAAARAGITSRQGDRALGLLELGLGHTEEAVRLLSALGGPPGADLVEAMVRCGRATEAAALALPDGPPGLHCRALLAGDADCEDLFAAALTAVSADRPFEHARLQLSFGERLRRMGQRTEARTHLRSARETFERLGARPWSDRAASELRATGERLGRREARRGDDLTPQELQVALLAADGATNKAIAAALFLSPKTVDFHLRRALRKLDLTSRAGLIKHFATASVR